MGGTMGERDQRGLGCGEQIVMERAREGESVKGILGLREYSKCKIFYQNFKCKIQICLN